LTKSPANTIKVALVGNPNAGKTSLFNALTGLNQKTGNYSGVTVDRFEGSVTYTHLDQKITLSVLDLPGTYSLFPKSGDEEVACRTLLDDNEQTDVVLIVADSTNLKRNLLLATQLIDLKFKTVMALNMMDEAQAQGIQIDVAGLSTSLGIDVVPVNSRGHEGFEELKAAIARARVSQSTFYDISAPTLQTLGSYRAFVAACMQNSGTRAKEENSDKLYRFNVINYLVHRHVKSPQQLSQRTFSANIDKIVTHKFFGYAVLLAILFLVFQFIFYVSEWPMNWIEQGFLFAGTWLSRTLPPGQLNDLVVQGVLPGISGVMMFIPQIAFLFLFIGLLEDSGYMARASFIMDRVMRPFGLNGKSVIPLISGTACAVPSIMATRSISSLRERLITIFITPLVSCSARLPVYTLLISVMYPNGQFFGIFNTRGVVLMHLYLLGFAAALLTAMLLKKVVKTKEQSFFIMELPVYRRPQLRSIGIMVYNRVKVFVTEAGKIILAISVILWFLSSHGAGEKYRQLEQQEQALAAAPNPEPTQLADLQKQKLENSFIGTLGHAVEPVIRPLGFDWKIGIALIASFAAREVFVGTMATIYQSGDSENLEGVRQIIVSEKDENGQLLYTPAVCWSLLVFYAFALQCISTIAVVKRETKSWKWVAAQLAFMSVLAYSSSLLVYHILV